MLQQQLALHLHRAHVVIKIRADHCTIDDTIRVAHNCTTLVNAAEEDLTQRGVWDDWGIRVEGVRSSQIGGNISWRDLVRIVKQNAM
jgi:hypothetical protein